MRAKHLIFRDMNANAGIELTPDEASWTYAASLRALKMVQSGEFTIDQALKKIKDEFGKTANMTACRKFVTESLDYLEDEDGNEYTS
jgi:hypothetical protein